MTASQENKINDRIAGRFNALVDKIGIRRSLTRRVSFVLTMLIAAALIISGSLVARQSFLVQEQEILARQVSVAAQAAIQIESFIERLRSELDVLTRAGHGELTHTGEYLSDVLDLEPAFLELIIIDPDGNILNSAATGDVVLGNLFTIQQAQWFLQAGVGREYLSGLQVSPTNEPYVILAQPIFVENRVEGIIASRVDMRVLWETVADIEVGQTGLAYVVNRSGILIAHPDADVVLSGVNLSTDPAFEGILNAPTGTAFSFNGLSEEPAVGGSVTIGDTDWQVITELPVSEAFAATRRAIVTYASLIAAALMVTFIALQILVRRMSRPIVELATATKQFGAGATNVQLPAYRGADEMGQLVVAFDDMVRQVGALTSGLEEQVSGRTRDLASAAEIGQRMAQVRDLDDLLAEAVELIRERFGLYHVQIYLKDATGRNQVLQASSGTVGEALLQRGHRLPIDLSSINGTAVIRKEAVIVPDTATSPLFHPNPLLPDTCAEMSVPLLLGDQVMGALDLQSNQAQALSSDDLPAFTTLASQLAIALDNARLFSEAAQAQAEVEAYARRLAHEGWQTFLDTFSQRERVGYTFDRTGIMPLADAPANETENNLTQAIEVVGESIGSILIEGDDDLVGTAETQTLVNRVAQQVAQQVESLRLLAETDRYRDEAEQAIRRLTHEGWQRFGAEMTEDGYLFDQNEIKPVAAHTTDDSSAVSHELQVHGESIGRLAVSGMALDETIADEMVMAVAQRLSAHIETLRLTAQTEQALGETAAQSRRLVHLNEMANALGAVDTMEDVFAVVPQYMGKIINHDGLALTLMEPDGQTIKTFLLGNEAGPVMIGSGLLGAGTAVDVAVNQRQMVYIPDLQQTDFLETCYMLDYGLRSSLMAPLLTARGVLGVLNISSQTAAAFDAQDKNIIQQITPLLASTLENQRLFAEAQQQAEKEHLVNVITQKIQSTVTIESALETAVQELGQALQAQYTQVKLSNGSEKSKLEEIA